MSKKTPLIRRIELLSAAKREAAFDAINDRTLGVRKAAAAISALLPKGESIGATAVHTLRAAIDAGTTSMSTPRAVVNPASIASARRTVRETEKGTTVTTSYVLRDDRTDIDLPAMSARARSLASTAWAHRPQTTPASATAVVIIGDAQLGKKDAFGGTPETLERVHFLREEIAGHMRVRNLEHIIVVDAGDIVEGIESAGGKGLEGNDLSPMEQVNAAGEMVLDVTTTFAQIAPVTYIAVPSNHAAFRRNGVTYGNPAVDDWGIVIAKRVADLARRIGAPISVVTPDARLREEAVRVEVYGHGLGVVHGHQTSGPAGIKKLVAGHSMNNGALSGCALIVSGHYHHLTLGMMGRSDRDAQAWHLQAPALDNGSSWFANLGGDIADPGAAYIEMTPDGVSVESLALFTRATERARPLRAVHVVA